jgi:hypothetical protein
MSEENAGSAEKLESAFESVIAKLDGLQRDLDADEHAAFMELMKAARAHAGSVQARDEGEPEKIDFMKPVQVHATSTMKERMANLPSEFSRNR